MNISNQETEQRLEAILDLTRGYRRDTVAACLYCIHCAACFDEEQIYPVKGGMVTAARAAREHVEDAHGGAFTALLAMGKQTTGLTEIQETLLRSFREGRSDRETANALGGKSESTIRNHRFQLRRRETEARILVALMALVAEDEPKERKLVEYPAGIPQRDERMDVTEEEAVAIETRYLRSSGSPRIVTWPKKQKEKLVLLRKISERFERGRSYTESEVNAILGSVYEDHVTIRRYLIDYRFLERESDGSEYRRR
jgi:DNA-binding CsgD family transcriptional regulator